MNQSPPLPESRCLGGEKGREGEREIGRKGEREKGREGEKDLCLPRQSQ
jgi:hypothetical protein